MADTKKLTPSFEKYWGFYSERKELEELSIEELYKKYKICKITINETDDPKIKDDNKKFIKTPADKNHIFCNVFLERNS